MKIIKLFILITSAVMLSALLLYIYFSEDNSRVIKTPVENSEFPAFDEKDAVSYTDFKGTSEGVIDATWLKFTVQIDVKSTWRIKKTGKNYKCFLQVNAVNRKLGINISKSASCTGTADRRRVVTFRQPSFNLTARGLLSSKKASGTWIINPELLKDVTYRGLPVTLRLKGSGKWSGRATGNNLKIAGNDKPAPPPF